MAEQNTTDPWYALAQPEQLDSPALLIYPDRAQKNIETMIKIAGDVGRCRPHVKTHKMGEVAKMHLDLGINKFKCATIAEAEMLAEAGASDVLLAYQPMGPRAKRLAKLAQAFPAVEFGCVVDNIPVAEQLSAVCAEENVTLNVWIDIDNGMARSGIAPNDTAVALYRRLSELPHLQARGLHVYDGHIRQPDFTERKSVGDAAFTAVYQLIDRLVEMALPTPNVVAGGSPAFPVHALRSDVDVSPGTYIFWDAGYAQICPELDFQWAAVVMTRVLSKPGENHICLDVGSKGVSPDKPLDKRIHFLNLSKQPEFVGQSEEHLVVKVSNQSDYEVGDIWYGIPGHVCPTVNLYQEANTISADGQLSDVWQVIARDRRINY